MHPVIFETKYFVIYSLWFFFALGIFATIYFIIRLSLTGGLKLAFLSDIFAKVILFGLFFARIGGIIENYSYYFTTITSDTIYQLIAIWDKNLNIWSGILGMIIYLYLTCKKREDQSFWKWLDIIVPSIIIGLAITHIGTFFEGSSYGQETSLPWGVNFESPIIKYTVPIHPTQIYAFLYSLAIAIPLILLQKSNHIREKFKELNLTGLFGLIGIFLYSLFYFLVEFVRGDDVLMIFSIRLGQIISFLGMISTGVILYLRYNKFVPRKIRNFFLKFKFKTK